MNAPASTPNNHPDAEPETRHRPKRSVQGKIDFLGHSTRVRTENGRRYVVVEPSKRNRRTFIRRVKEYLRDAVRRRESIETILTDLEAKVNGWNGTMRRTHFKHEFDVRLMNRTIRRLVRKTTGQTIAAKHLPRIKPGKLRFNSQHKEKQTTAQTPHVNRGTDNTRIVRSDFSEKLKYRRI